MEIRKAYLSMIKDFPGGADSLSAGLGMTRDALENRVFERKGQRLSVDTAMQMQAFSGSTHFAEAIARATGGVFLKLPDVVDVGNVDLSRKFHELYTELGAFSQRYAEATDDNKITRKEKADLTAIADEMHKTLQELLQISFQVFCVNGGEKGAAQ